MRFTAEKDAILGALSFVARYSDVGAKINVLRSVLVEAVGNTVTLTATDLDRAARGSFEAEIKSEGSACLPAQAILNLVKSAAGDVGIAVDGNFATISAGRSRLRAPVLPAADFPSLPMLSYEGAASFGVDAGILAGLSKKVSFARQADGKPYYLAGTSWQARDGGVDFCAADGKRLASMRAGVDAKAMPDIIVPELDIPAWTGNVTVTVSDHFIRLGRGSQTIATKLIEATYPDYRRVIPTGGSSLFFDRAELLGAVNRAAIVADKRDHSIMVLGRVGEASLSAVTERGEINDVVRYDGPDFQIAFTHAVLSSVLGSFDCETVEIGWTSHTMGATIRDPADPSRLSCMQPYADWRLIEHITPTLHAAE